MRLRPLTRRTLTASAAILALTLATAGCTTTAQEGPEPLPAQVRTLYTPLKDAPKPGALYARATQLTMGPSKGALLATFEQYTAGKPVFPIYRSTDDGRSWKKFSVVTDTRNGWGLRYQPFLYQLPSAVGDLPAGTILAAGNSIPDDLSKTKLDLYASRDDGRTWGFVSSFASGGRAIPNNGETPVWEPFLLVAGGKLIAYYSDQRDPKHGQKLVHETTTDGVTWSKPVDDEAEVDPAARPGMTTVARLGDGRWAMTYEYGGAPEADFAVYIKIADDPEKFGSVAGKAIFADGIIPTSSPYVVWVGDATKGKLVVSAGSSPLLFESATGADGTWKAVRSAIPQGYTRALVPLADHSGLFGISAGPIGAECCNAVKYATDPLR